MSPPSIIIMPPPPNLIAGLKQSCPPMIMVQLSPMGHGCVLSQSCVVKLKKPPPPASAGGMQSAEEATHEELKPPIPPPDETQQTELPLQSDALEQLSFDPVEQVAAGSWHMPDIAMAL